MKCLYCHNSFTANRGTAKYCSAKCRVYFNRRGVTLTKRSDVTLSDKSVTLKQKTVTLTNICKEHGIDKQYCKMMKHKS